MNLYVWGTGRLTGKVLGRYLAVEQVTAFVDNDAQKTEWLGKPVIRPAELAQRDYDAVIVITLHSPEIYQQGRELGLDMKKMIFLYQNIALQDLNQDYDLVASIFGREYAAIVKERYHLVRGVETRHSLCLKDKYSRGGYFKTDYVRMKCFELAVKEIRKRNIPGDVAEVGVFQGEFAQFVNAAFPDRTCYLCDTFEGFQPEEAAQEMQQGNATQAFVNAYQNTSEELVMEKMEHKDRIVLRKGYFPDTMQDIDTAFAFVSIDMDFEASIYEGLRYFYPRLSRGGYIFLHDYNSSLYGVEHAVDRYEKDHQILLPKVPLCDANGTLVIVK